jgi:hypothetical protein
MRCPESGRQKKHLARVGGHGLGFCAAAEIQPSTAKPIVADHNSVFDLPARAPRLVESACQSSIGAVTLDEFIDLVAIQAIRRRRLQFLLGLERPKVRRSSRQVRRDRRGSNLWIGETVE